MLVTCPKCKTTYKVSDELVQGAVPSFRCSRCRHTFELEAPDTSAKVASGIPSAEQSLPGAADQELTFAFPHEEEAKKLQPEDDASPADKPGPSSARNKDAADNPWRMTPGQAHNEENFTLSDRATGRELNRTVSSRPQPQVDDFQPASMEHENGDKILSLDPYRDHQVSTVPYLTLFGLLLIFYGLATVFNYSHPNATEGVVGKIPLLGSSVLKNTHLKNGVALQSLQASYQSIQGNREVFVITGVALNQNPVKIRELRVSGEIYNQAGKAIEQQTVWVGNAISAKIVRGMTAQDISDLQRLKPLKTFDIPPGDSVPFTIVFLKPAKGVKDFSCGVVAAEGETA